MYKGAMPIDDQIIAQTLRRMLADLDELAASDAQSKQAVTLDQSSVGRLSRMDAMQQKEMDREAVRRRMIQRQQIKGALMRLAEGDYGYCVKCDQKISERRLAADPATPFCVRCAGGGHGR
jgi:DnaK suppressor protein